MFARIEIRTPLNSECGRLNTETVFAFICLEPTLFLLYARREIMDATRCYESVSLADGSTSFLLILSLKTRPPVQKRDSPAARPSSSTGSAFSTSTSSYDDFYLPEAFHLTLHVIPPARLPHPLRPTLQTTKVNMRVGIHVCGSGSAGSVSLSTPGVWFWVWSSRRIERQRPAPVPPSQPPPAPQTKPQLNRSMLQKSVASVASDTKQILTRRIRIWMKEILKWSLLMGVRAPGMERSISASTSAGSMSASALGSGSGYGVVEPQWPAPVPPPQPPPAPQTKPPQLNRSTSQKSVAPVASAVSATSDGEVGIGLSLMASLGGDDSEDDSEYGGGDETVRMEGKFDDDDDEGGLSYAQSQSQFALLSASTSAASSVPLNTPTTPHFNPQQGSKSNVPNPISTLGHSQLRNFSSASTPQYQSQTPSPALSTHSAVSASQSVCSHAISKGESSTYSDSTSEGGGGRGLDSPIAAFPRPPAANEMEARRLILMMQQQQGQQLQQMSQEVPLPTIQPQQRNLGSAMGGRSFGAASTASVSSWGSIGRAVGIHRYLVLSWRIYYYTPSWNILNSTKPFSFSTWWNQLQKPFA
ncbi:hypothetical protein VKT23_010605 [Stygiomarasmius scandens]|uniref:Uncharacterized protein n=1 Tax=Marasmiellus scandens TaxID=2682957 RepID=A0ABR1JAP5_9AGAR